MVVGERASLVVVEGQMEAEGGLVGVVQPADVVTNLRNGPNDARRVVWALFPLRGPALAFLAAVGLCGLSWASSGPMRGVAGVVQPADVVTYLRNGPNDARRVVWALFGLRGPALAFVGRRWRLCAFVGLRWPLLAVVGRCWLLWAFVGLRWPSLAFVGRRWPLLAAVGLRGLRSNKKIKNKK